MLKLSRVDFELLKKKLILKYILYERLINLWPVKRGRTRWLKFVSNALQVGPYGWTKEKTIRFLKDQAGTQFDPEIVRIFLDLVAGGKIQDG